MSTLTVPPVFPEPLVVPNNVADARRTSQTRFIRQTLMWFLFSLLYIVGWGWLPSVPIVPVVPPSLPIALVVLSAAVLSLIRFLPLNCRMQRNLSAATFLASGPAWGALLHLLGSAGVPIAFMLVASTLAAVAYAQLSGRDYSFVSSFAIQFGTGAAATIGFGIWYGSAGRSIILQVLLWAMVSAFLVYNLTCVMRRRQPHESISAALDFYRDPLNFVTYPIRIWQHWRRYPVWDPPRKPGKPPI